ncbi:MAG TPA: hypothetical protein VND95_08435 [Stellaceae bacterium]|nr:hypothetical protein [Stellaceae bacterium]
MTQNRANGQKVNDRAPTDAAASVNPEPVLGDLPKAMLGRAAP